MSLSAVAQPAWDEGQDSKKKKKSGEAELLVSNLHLDLVPSSLLGWSEPGQGLWRRCDRWDLCRSV